ncbi:MAG: CPBP family intramembrane metalloprotease [Anaerolineae bacterium]|nr:CPBP family intramembrane metalloprotease [Anaerolineae bacterium]
MSRQAEPRIASRGYVKVFVWINNSRLLRLAKEGKRLTPWWAALPLSVLILLLSSLPAGLMMLTQWPGGQIVPSAYSALVAGLRALLLLLSAFGGVILLVWLWTGLYEKRAFYTLGFERKDALRQYGLGLLTGCLMFAGAVLLMAVPGFLASDTSGPGSQGWVALGGVLVIFPGWMVQGAAEEVLMRGWLMPSLGARYRPWAGIVISSVFFAVMHSLNPNLSLLALLNLLLYGLFAALYALRAGSLWGICALHAAWNWTQGNIFGLEVSGSGVGGGMVLNLMEAGPDWFTGGAFGPEGGLAVTLVLVAGILAVLLWKRPEGNTVESTQSGL